MQNQGHYKLPQETPDGQQQQPVMGQVVQGGAYQYSPLFILFSRYPQPQQYQVAYPAVQQAQPTQQQTYMHAPPQAQPVQHAVQVGQPYMIQYPPQMIHPTSRYSQTVNCQQCSRQVQSVIQYEAGNGAYVIGGLMAVTGLWLGCCLIPCLMEDCKDAVHYCPSCGSQVGKKKFLFE